MSDLPRQTKAGPAVEALNHFPATSRPRHFGPGVLPWGADLPAPRLEIGKIVFWQVALMGQTMSGCFIFHLKVTLW